MNPSDWWNGERSFGVILTIREGENTADLSTYFIGT